jgi:hypothetical protein
VNSTTIGLDIAKSVFQVHGVDAQGKVVVVSRSGEPSFGILCQSVALSGGAVPLPSLLLAAKQHTLYNASL